MALELSNKTWRVTFGDGARRRQVAVPAGDLAKLGEALSQAKERFGLPAFTPGVSCYEAGRDGFWLHRCLVVAESLPLKHQLIVSSRTRRRAPNLTSLDRFVVGMTSLLVRPRRIAQLAAILGPTTLFRFHKALVDGKYRLLFSSKGYPLSSTSGNIHAWVQYVKRLCPWRARTTVVRKYPLTRLRAQANSPDGAHPAPIWRT